MARLGEGGQGDQIEEHRFAHISARHAPAGARRRRDHSMGSGSVRSRRAVAAATIASGTTAVRANVTVQFGSTPATLLYAGLAPAFVGLYQLNVTVPGIAAGDQALVVSLNGTPVAQNLFLTVGQ